MKVSEAVGTLDALAQESRLAVFRLLVAIGPEGAAAGRIAEHLELHAATLSFHLSILKQAELVKARRESRSIIYSANFDRMNDLVSYLTAHCCRGAEPRPGLPKSSRRARRVARAA